MKIMKKSLRLWFTLVSMFSFLAGWVLLAHANKPAPLQVDPPALSAPAANQPSQFFSRNFNSEVFPFSNQFQSQSFGPRLRTGGS